MKSFRTKDGSDEPPDPARNGDRSFHGEERSNETHTSRTDPQAQLHPKGGGKEATLAFLGHALMENRDRLIVDADLTQANGLADLQAAQRMITRHAPDARRCARRRQGLRHARLHCRLRQLNVAPHVAQNDTTRRSAIDGRTTGHSGYAASQRKRKRIEESFGWGKTIGGLARPMLRGVDRLRFKFALTMESFELIRLQKLLAAETLGVRYRNSHTPQIAPSEWQMLLLPILTQISVGQGKRTSAAATYLLELL